MDSNIKLQRCNNRKPTMKIDVEVKKAEKEIKEKLDKATNAGGSGPSIPWDFIEIQIIIQLAVEAIIKKRIKKAIEN